MTRQPRSPHSVYTDAADATPRAAPGRFRVLGIDVDRLSIAQAVAAVDGFVREGRPRQVVTVNPEFVIAADRHPAFRRVLNGADLATADGVGILWAARILGDRLPERVGGVELMEALAALAAARGYRIFLLGAAEGVAAEAGRRLAARHAGLIVAGTLAGSPTAHEEAAILDRITAAVPQLLFVAFGAPQQELWIARNRERLGVPVTMGVGGAFDYLAGRVPRAPRRLQRAGLEWLYRLLRQPWRWRRMLALPRFGLRVLLARLIGRRRRRGH